MLKGVQPLNTLGEACAKRCTLQFGQPPEAEYLFYGDVLHGVAGLHGGPPFDRLTVSRGALKPLPFDVEL
jgi:hypothetical protein